MAHHILAIDQGTTSTRCLVFDAERCILATARRELAWPDALAAAPEGLRRFTPAMASPERTALLAGWQAAVRRALTT